MNVVSNRQLALKQAISMGEEMGSIDIIKLANNNDVRVFSKEMMDSNSAYIEYEKDTKEFRIFVNSIHSKERQRFSIAHELAHFILHAYEVKKQKRVDRGSVQSLTKGKEEEADAFAAELLMPEQLVKSYMDLHGVSLRNVVNTKIINGLSEKFKVSHLAAIVRLRNLKYYIPYREFI